MLSRICQWQKYFDGSRFYRESINQTKSFSMDQEAVEKLSRIYRPDSKLLDGSRSYQDKFQKARWIKIALTSIVKRRKRGSINANLSRSCQAWRKWVFQREEKHIEMNATSKLLKHKPNQHVKLSKTSLKKKKNAKHPWFKTHTHNKSNQFYISKTSYDSLVSIH